MRLEFDLYRDRASWIHGWEPRCKVLGLLGLIFAFAFVQSLWLLIPMVLVTLTLYGLSQLPFCFWLNRLRYPGLFLLGIVALLPFSAGQTVLWQWGWLTLYQEGCAAVLLIAVRFLCIVTIALILIGSTPLLTLLNALRSLGISPILTDMTLLTYRYLADIGDSFTTMRTAMRLRGSDFTRGGFISSGRHLTQIAHLTGTLLIRSYEQSERVYKAMRLRGYGLQTRLPQQEAHPQQRASVIALILSWLVAAGFILATGFKVG
ncbi:cobalt ECF transporter T component CbiQ [Pantanalinema rosaneae CENA516]|uniref:cobalt ECF transporter T component CbiQ n=1 Tax=Pantanalinema rosaneae TaxID=1620701 RepID=UPI003D6EF871